MKLLVATTSVGKLAEIKDILGDLPLEILMLNEVSLPDNFKVKEAGRTFAENASLKAKAYGEATDLVTLADDSGLCVEALGGKPGIYTARYTQGSDQDRWRKLLAKLGNLPLGRRTAKFVCMMALYNPLTKKMVVKEGICQGKIAFGPKGEHGFGYDPVFVVDKLNRHFAQLTREEKNQISHRARALKKIKPFLQKLRDKK